MKPLFSTECVRICGSTFLNLNRINKSYMKISISLTLIGLLLETAAAPMAVAAEELSTIAQSREWLNLLHYGDGWLYPKAQSRVDRETYFISPDGSTNPQAELEATIEALSKPAMLVGGKKTAAACAFPVRKQFLEKKLRRTFPHVSCPKLEEYIRDTHSDRVSLIFSTAYPNNPGSMFGHTFLKFMAPGKPDLMQPSIGYAAFVGQDGGMIYMIRGLFGGYRGAFGMTPYYAKLNEYVRSESRDLWEYDLNLSPAEVKTLALHIWELETSGGFDYYFFDENCSFILMRALEVAKPEWDLQAPRLFTIPGVTARQLIDQGNAVKEVKFRPSLRRQLVELYETLDDREGDELRAVLNGVKKASDVSSPRVLDVALTEIQYQKKSGSQLDQEIRQARSKMSAPAFFVSPEKMKAKNRPELGHAPTQLSLGGGVFEGNAFASLGFKFAFHDLLNSDLGYEPFSHIDFPSVRLRLMDHKGFYVERVGLVAITSLFPWTEREKSRSWKMAFDIRPARDLECSTCRVAHFDFGLGVALHPWTDKVVTSGLFSLYTDVGSVLSGARIGPKLEWLTVASVWDWYKVLVDVYWSGDVFQSKRKSGFWTFEAGQSFRLARDVDFRMSVSRVAPSLSHSNSSQEAQASLQVYW